VTQTVGEEGNFFSNFPVTTTVPVEQQLDNVRSALRRGLPQVRRCRPHGHVLSVAAGGPSLEDTWRDLGGYVAAVNGSLGFLLERGVVPNACGVLDPNPHMADVVARHDNVSYFVASVCHPALFDKLEGCHVVLWHPLGPPGLEELIRERMPDSWLAIGGGTTMGLRWLNLAYVMGFRTFRMHGLDSSFRDDRTHAYPDRDRGETVTVNGRRTRLNFLVQIEDFKAVLERFSKPDFEPIDLEIFGAGLLQDQWKRCQPWPSSTRETISVVAMSMQPGSGKDSGAI
jgi:hypothetical protein